MISWAIYPTFQASLLSLYSREVTIQRHLSVGKGGEKELDVSEQKCLFGGDVCD
jgi:hypothetical protein